MAQCVLCTHIAQTYCLSDRCFLCFECDKTIHSANVISRGHKRVPVCELCKRSAATVYCQEDAAALCSGCEVEVHSSNPLPHTVVPIDAALASGAVKSAGLPYLTTQGSSGGEVAVQQQQAQPAPAEDEVSACNGAPDQQQGCSSEGNTGSLAVVPDMQRSSDGAQLNATAAALAGKDGLKNVWGKDDFDALDFEAAWLSNLEMGLDFSDILGNDASLDVPGMVPTVPSVAEEPKPMQPVPAPAVPVKLEQPVAAYLNNVQDILEPALEDDFVVPSFLPDEASDDELASPVAASTSLTGVKRTAEQAVLAPPPPVKTPATEQLVTPHMMPPQQYPQQYAQYQQYSQYTQYQQAEMPSGMYPPTTYATMPPAPMPEVTAPVTRAAAQQQSQGSALTNYGNGANLTREQRVARYREKRKNRKFQKTIRYASRKAYAEVRPRIKGRFATREEVAAWKARQEAGLVGPDEEFSLV